MMSIETLVSYENAESGLTNAENFERSLQSAIATKPDDMPGLVLHYLEELHRWAQFDLRNKRSHLMDVI